MADAVQRVRSQMKRGEALRECENCGSAIPEARRKAVAGVRLCVACQEVADEMQVSAMGYNRRGSKDSQLR